MGLFLKDINLKGKTALITGATKGLGRGTAQAIAEAGGDIIAIGRNQSELNSLGKINCDAFSNVSARKKYTQKFDTKRSGQVNAFLVFMDRASLLPCYKSWSEGEKIASDPIPLDLRAKIVSFKLENGKLYLAIEDIRTSRDVHQLNYELITEENLQQQLRVLRA